MGFPVFSRAIHAKGTIKATLGSVNIPVVCAGCHGQPRRRGDCRCRRRGRGACRHRRSKWPMRPKTRESFEGEKRAKFAAGVLGLDMYKMREAAGKSRA